MTGLVWRLEWARALARRRLFRLNVVVPLALVAALVVGGAPRVHAAVAYTTLFVFFATFGSAVPIVRDGEGGLLARITLTGFPPGRYLVERAVAGASLDLVQLAPALVLVGVTGSLRNLPVAFAALFLALLVANVVGICVAAAARSVAESALFASVISLLLLHASGVFRTPVPGSWGAEVLALSPYAALHRAALSLGGLATGPVPLELLASGALWCGVAVALSLASSARIMRRLS